MSWTISDIFAIIIIVSSWFLVIIWSKTREWQSMTNEQAAALARERYGQNARVIYDSHFIYDNCYQVIDGSGRFGSGRSWEEAFADAEKNDPAKRDVT